MRSRPAGRQAGTSKTGGVGLEGLSWHRAAGAGSGAPGLVLGYANLTGPAIESGLTRVGDAFAAARGA